MPLGDPEAYMEQGMPEDQAMMEAGMAPPAPAPDTDQMMMMLMQMLMQKWSGAEAQTDMEKQMLVQTLMELVAPAPQMGPQDFAEGGMMPGAGPMPPMDGGML